MDVMESEDAEMSATLAYLILPEPELWGWSPAVQ